MIARDHMDLGCSVCTLGSVGAANIFHSHNLVDPLPPPDDLGTPYITWPNFHSGANGDFQRVTAPLPVHPVMRDVESDSGAQFNIVVAVPTSSPKLRCTSCRTTCVPWHRRIVTSATPHCGWPAGSDPDPTLVQFMS